MYPSTALVLIGLVSLVLAVRLRPSRRRLATLVLAGITLGTLISWTGQGRFHKIGDRGHHNMHVGETFHYYLGSRVFGEVGHYDLYLCSSVALSELSETHDKVRPIPVRDLRDKLQWITLPDVLAESDRCHEAFGDRWSLFVDDIRTYLRLFKGVGPGFLNGILGDAGYNSSPAFAMLYGLPFRDLPVRKVWKWMGWVDFALVAGLAVALVRVFGWRAALLFLFVFGANPMARYNWIGGSWFRLIWFVAVGLGLMAIWKERWFLAGLLFGYVTMERGFPAVFAASAVLVLAPELRTEEGRQRMMRLVGGGALAGVVLGLSSTLVYGVGSWVDFWVNARAHGHVFWIPHVGLSKAIAYDPNVVPGWFGGTVGAEAFRVFEQAAQDRLSARYPAFVLSALAMLGLGVAAALKDRNRARGAFTLGVVLLFVLTRPAAYYFVMLALFPALDLAGRPDNRDRVLAMSTLGLLAASWAIYAHAGNLVLRFDQFSIALVVYLFGRTLFTLLPEAVFEDAAPEDESGRSAAR